MATINLPLDVSLFWFHGVDQTQIGAAIEAVRYYVIDPSLPQHSRLGKYNGGGYRMNGALFWVWKTKTGWHVSPKFGAN